jgi:type IV secretion system protein VirB9
MLKYWIYLLVVLWCVAPMQGRAQQQPIITDSRIKTLIYNENDVYALLTHHGYQANIEFGEKEIIQTISVGDRISWQIIPDGRRLFIRSNVPSAHTNMTVITNKRSYNFDIRATNGGAIPVKEELVYVVKFYYPDEHIPKGAEELPPVYADEVVASAQKETEVMTSTLPPLNFNYTFAGRDDLAPVKVFDDGQFTYIKLSQSASIFTIDQAGREIPVNISYTSDGFAKIPTLSPRFLVRYNQGQITIYNEQMSSAQ